MKAILIMLHVESKVGYAISSLLPVFVDMARHLVSGDDRIFISFTKLNNTVDVPGFGVDENIVEYNPSSSDSDHHKYFANYVLEHDIDCVFGFDQRVKEPAYEYLRGAGVQWIISYLGAPLSGLNSGLKLWLKKIEVLISRHSPDHYIFESEAMAMTAYQGRGISRKSVSVVPLGVDTDKFRPSQERGYYAYEQFQIPRDRKIIYFSGHMEERKGVGVLMQAALDLYERYSRRDYHFLLLGNKNGEERAYLDMLIDSGAMNHVTFGGYRYDVDQVIPSCYCGVIASTGWDSFTMSSLEIASCGLPLIVSQLQGLVESIEDGATGYFIAPGDHLDLCSKIMLLMDNESVACEMGVNARERVLANYSVNRQINRLVDIVSNVTDSGK